MLHVLAHLRLTNQIALPPIWGGLLGVTLMFFLGMRYLRKRTVFFYVPGR